MTIRAHHRFLPVAFALLLILAGAREVSAQPRVIAPTGKWVTDQADLLADQEERILGLRLKSFADTTSTQMIVVTVPDLGGAEAADYAVELGRVWAVGQGDRDNGIVLLISRDDRQVYIATGFGLEGAIPDAVAARIVRNVILPSFKKGAFYDGISDAVDALMLAASGEYDALPASGPEVDPIFFLMVAFVVLVLILIIVSNIKEGGGGGGKRRRGRSGPVIIFGDFGHPRGGFGGFGGSSGGFGGGGGFGGFSGGGGSFGGGGAGGGW